jgi:hypothetical protein
VRSAAALLALAMLAACGDKDAIRQGDDAGPEVPQAPPPKVSKPGETAIAALKKVKEPRALLFFPPGPMADQVLGYLTDLGGQAGVSFEVREIDRLIEVEQAKRFRVATDGVVVLVSGDASESIALQMVGDRAAADMARLDGKVARALVRLARGRRAVALVVHQVADVGRFQLVGEALATLGFEATTVTAGKDVPAGALAIFLDAGAGPTRPAMESIDRHLAAGGAALVAIEPRRGASLGPVGERLGLRLDPRGGRGVVRTRQAASGSGPNRLADVGAVAVEREGAKAIVVADASWLTDDVLRAAPADQALFRDAVGWLTGAEAMAAETIDEPATGDRLTLYPMRTRQVAGHHGALWKVAPDGVHGIRFETRGRTVLLERRDGGLWARVERPSPDGAVAALREFPLAPEAGNLFAALAEPVPLRAVGPLDATTRARYALEDGTLTVDLAGGATHTVLVGSRVMGSGDRYAADAAGRTVVILPASLIEPIDQTDRIALRRVLDLDPGQLSRMAIIASDGRMREAVKSSSGAWEVNGGGSEDAYQAEEIARAAFRLTPTEFVPAAQAVEMTARGKVTLTAGSAAPVDLEIFTRSDGFWLRTPLTRGLYGRVSAGSARRIADAIAALTGAPP